MSLATVVIGVYLIRDGALTMGGLIACHLLSSRAMAPIGQVAGLLVQYHSAATAFESLDELMKRLVERPPEMRFTSRPSCAARSSSGNVGFAYREGEEAVLREVSASAPARRWRQFSAAWARAKTTLEKLILGLYRPGSGAVLSGRHRPAPARSRRVARNIGYVPQEDLLRPLRDNIAMVCCRTTTR